MDDPWVINLMVMGRWDGDENELNGIDSIRPYTTLTWVIPQLYLGPIRVTNFKKSLQQVRLFWVGLTFI